MRRLVVLALAVCTCFAASPSFAAGGKPIQLALFAPAQLVPEGESVSGLRLNVIYGVNQDVQGLDLGLINHVRGTGFSWQWGGVGFVEGNFTGFQDNVINITKGEFTGLNVIQKNKVPFLPIVNWSM